MPGQQFFAVLARAGHCRLVLGADRAVRRAAADGRMVARPAPEGRWADRLFGWVPWTGRMLRCSRTATFLEVLALLVENETPLPEAVVLAAEASGDPHDVAIGPATGRRAPKRPDASPPAAPGAFRR